MNSDTSLDINNHSNPVQTVAQPKEDMWKHQTSPAASANRGYISNMTLLAISPWMN